jgi:DNA topoisomerase-1
MRYYAKYTGIEDKPVPALEEGDELVVIKVDCEQKFEQPPARYNQSSLLEKMEKESIGTKATRAEIISTLISRGYMGGDGGLAATDLGLSVIEIMKKYSPDIVSTSLTREMEAALERVENGELREHELKERAIDLLLEQIMLVKSNEENIGREISTSVVQTAMAQSILGKCPVCHTGNLRMIRSAKTKKRFVGCTNYQSGCRASAPLPQRGTIKPAKSPCRVCGWPVVYVRSGRYPWRLCVNVNCGSKSEWRRKNDDAVQAVQKKN